MPEYLNQFIDKVIEELPNIATALLIFVASIYVAKLLSNLLKRVLERREADHEVTHLIPGGHLVRQPDANDLCRGNL